MNSVPADTSLSQSPAARDRLLVAQKELLERIVRGGGAGEILEAIVAVVEDQSSTPSVATIMLLDPESGCLMNAASRRLPQSYLESVNGVRVDSGIGTCPLAAEMNEPVFSQDVEADPRWEGYHHLVTVLGLEAVWSLPIRGSDGRVLGTISTYFTEKRLPDEREILVANLMAETAALAIERTCYAFPITREKTTEDEIHMGFQRTDG